MDDRSWRSFSTIRCATTLISRNAPTRPSSITTSPTKPSSPRTPTAGFARSRCRAAASSRCERSNETSSRPCRSRPRTLATFCTPANFEYQMKQYQALVPINPGGAEKVTIPDIVVVQGRTQHVKVVWP